jgi:hypothetical protein
MTSCAGHFSSVENGLYIGTAPLTATEARRGFPLGILTIDYSGHGGNAEEEVYRGYSVEAIAIDYLAFLSITVLGYITFRKVKH